MKFIQLAGLAIVPLALAAPFSVEQEEKTVNNVDPLDVGAVNSALSFENSIAGLVRNIAQTIDGVLSADAAQRHIDTPVSINSIIEQMFISGGPASELGKEDSHSMKADSVNSVINNQANYGSQAVTDTVHGFQGTVNGNIDGPAEIDASLLTSLRQRESVGQIQKAIDSMINSAEHDDVMHFAKRMRTLFESLFKNFGTGNSPVERIIRELESLVMARTVNLQQKADMVDGQVLSRDEIENLLTSFRDQIRLAVREYIEQHPLEYFGVVGAFEEVESNAVLEAEGLTYFLIRITENVIGAFVPDDPVSDIVDVVQHSLPVDDLPIADPPIEKPPVDLPPVSNPDLPPATAEQAASAFFEQIKQNARATYLMGHVLSHASDIQYALDNHVNNVQKIGLHGINDGLYLLLNDQAEMEKITHALTRNAGPLGEALAHVLQKFIETNADILAAFGQQNRALLGPDLVKLVFSALDKIVAKYQEDHQLLGLVLKKSLVFIETIYNDDPDILTNDFTAINLLNAVNALVDAINQALKARILLF
ncbi:hypothetical protein BDB00DRAFT_787087 [Zychaea mexicana]|uniref:uncharacterized protein n=1 Tax=Zychaea mexicana TaxID=64656 RepID=UPI0022FDCEB6|nr:uncharacterized protein BDB00DRAFT_787087 [Zychaea mexicana]KAI9494473.1 hypothetical protein BDB00DRAFT_787087 [Zychaea mexicana]